ncbi:MAG: hypothetical protein ACI89L_001474 [Phycisphaerales bacterium]|jgi:hypothetical protein
MDYNATIDRISQLSSAEDDHRAKPRFDPSMVRCDKGKLVDISASGFAVRSRGRWGGRGDVTAVELWSPNGRFMAQVEVMRVRRVGLLKFETGCRFTEPEAINRPLFDLFRERVGSAGGEFMVRSAG